MKRIFALALALLFCLPVLAACGNQTDAETIKEKGYFVCGITYYEPINYFDADGNLTGFDTEFAQLVAAELGLEAKFQVINWSSKYMELQSGSIDCIWNGFTSNCADDDGVQRSEKVSFSTAYLDNAQCVVVKSDAVASYTSADSLKGKKCAVEGGSAGATYAAAVTDADKIASVDSQTQAFTELLSGSVDFIVVDVLLANERVGTGDYVSLAKATAIEIEKEEYAIGFRKDSDFVAEVNAAIETLAKNGKLAALAEKYGLNLTEALIALGAAK